MLGSSYEIVVVELMERVEIDKVCVHGVDTHPHTHVHLLVVLEKGDAPGEFWKDYPRHGSLQSASKQFTGDRV